MVEHKLRRRKMARAAMLGRLDHDRKIPDDRFGDDPLVNWRASFAAPYLCAKRQYVILIVDDGGTVYGSHATNRVDHSSQGARPFPSIFLSNFVFLAHQFGKCGERGCDRIENRLRNRLAPAFCTGGYDEENTAVSVG